MGRPTRYAVATLLVVLVAHPHLPALSDSAVRAEVQRAAAAILTACRYDARPDVPLPVR